jgi:hypothetical protein
MKFKKIYVLKIENQPYEMFFEYLISAKVYLKRIYPQYKICYTYFDSKVSFIKIYDKKNFVGYITTKALF